MEAVADFGGRAQDPGVEAVGEDAPATLHQAVEALGDADRQALDGPREGAAVVGLDEQVDVVALDGELHDADREALRAPVEGLLDHPETAPAAQAPDVVGHAQRHVHRQPPPELGARPVRDPRALALRLAPRSLPLAAPGADPKRELWGGPGHDLIERISAHAGAPVNARGRCRGQAGRPRLPPRPAPCEEGPMPTELPSPHRERVEAQLRLLEAARASLPPGVEGTVAPYFAHLRVSSGGRRRDVLLGPRTHVGGRVTILNWHEAPLAAAFFAAAEGEDYEIDVEGDGDRTLTGTVLEKNLLGFERGELVEILTPELALSRRSGRWEVRGEVERLRLDPRPAGSRSASPVEVPLDPAQRRVVDLPPGGAVLLLGEAGSGKTTVALHRLAHLVHAAEAERRRFRGGVIVPTEGLRRFAQAMLERLGAGTVEVRTWDAWAAAESRRAFPDVPPGDSEGASAAVVRLKRHRALAVAIEALVARRPRSGKPAGARRRDLLHLFGNRLLMEQVVAAAGSGLPAAALPEVLEHTRVQFNRPTEAESGHVDAERLKTVDQRRDRRGHAHGGRRHRRRGGPRGAVRDRSPARPGGPRRRAGRGDPPSLRLPVGGRGAGAGAARAAAPRARCPRAARWWWPATRAGRWIPRPASPTGRPPWPTSAPTSTP